MRPQTCVQKLKLFFTAIQDLITSHRHLTIFFMGSIQIKTLALPLTALIVEVVWNSNDRETTKLKCVGDNAITGLNTQLSTHTSLRALLCTYV